MTRLFDLLYHQAENCPLDQSISARSTSGKWISYSSQQMLEAAEQAASGLVKAGLKPGDKVAIVAYKNRPEWLIMDFAIQLAGLVSIPLYPTISTGEYEYILNEAEVKMAFCGGLDLYDKLSTAQKNTPSLSHIYCFDSHPDRPFWRDIFDAEGIAALQPVKDSIKGSDLMTIIYTSGTTGNPKGVMLTHSNIMFVVMETSHLLKVDAGEKVLSFLPTCHIYERAVSFVYYFKGASVHYCGTDNLSGPEGDLASVKPVVFTTVPRLLEKIYEAIYNKGLALEGAKRNLFFWALSLTDDFEVEQKLSFVNSLKWKVADKLIFSKWRAALGGNVRMIVTGAAPCPVKILKVFCGAGINIKEAYGLTETSPTLTGNRMEPGGTMLGTVGYAVDGVDLRIDASSGDYGEGEGEILAHGPNIMQGYYKKPDVTARVFKEIDGKTWFCTGDIGKFIPGESGRQFLKITDRKKELLKTSGGKYVAPAPIENRFREDFLVEQIMVVGDKQKFVSALIVPAEEALKNWCEHKGIEWSSMEEMVRNEKVIAKYQKIITRLNQEFSHIEQIKKFRLIPTSWLPMHEDRSEAELTPTLKLKRRVIRRKYGREIKEIYA